MTQVCIYDDDVEIVDFTCDELQVSMAGGDDPQVYRLSCGSITYSEDGGQATGRLFTDFHPPKITRQDIRPILQSLELIR